MTVHDYLRSCGLTDPQTVELFEREQVTLNSEGCGDPDQSLAVGDRVGVRQLGALIVVSGLTGLRPGGPT